MALKITTDIGRVDTRAWEKFVYDHPDGNIFQMPCMYEIHQNTKHQKPLTFFAFDNDELVGVLMAVHFINTFPPMSFFTRRQIVFGGPLIKENDSGILLALWDALFHQTAKAVVYTEIRNYRLGLSLKPVYEEAGFYYESYLTVTIDMNRKSGELWASLSPDRKENIEKMGQVSHVVKELEDDKEFLDAWHILNGTILSKGRPLSHRSMMYAIRESKALMPYLRTRGLFINGKMKATIWLLLFDDKASVWMEGNMLDDSEQWLYDGFLWGIIQELQSEGIRFFEMGNGGKPGQDFYIRQYKKSYGGMVRETGRYIYVHNWFLWNLGRRFYKWYKKLTIFFFRKYFRI